MPVEAKPLFRPDVLRPYVDAFKLPDSVAESRPLLAKWVDMLATDKADTVLEEKERWPDFFVRFKTDVLPRYLIAI